MPIDVLQHDDVVRIGRTWILDGTAPTADDGTIETLSSLPVTVPSQSSAKIRVNQAHISSQPSAKASMKAALMFAKSASFQRQLFHI